MLKKLKLVLGNLRGLILSLILRVILLSGLLFFVFNQTKEFSRWLFTAVFLIIAFYFYFRPTLNVSQFFASFLILLIAPLLAINQLLITNYQLLNQLLITIFFGFLFFLLLGIKNLVFVKREPLYYFLNAPLLLFVFILFFSSNLFHWFSFKYILLFIALVFLLREFLAFSLPDIPASRKRSLIIYSVSFLTLQLVWLIGLLPLSSLYSASFSLLIFLILQDFIINYFCGKVSRQLILRNATVFMIITLLIFSASKWTP